MFFEDIVFQKKIFTAMWGLLLKSQTSTLERFQVSLAFRSRSGILTSTPLAWTWEWKWDPRHLEQHENNFPCQDSRITWKTCLHTILSNWNMNGWLIEKCLHTVNPHFQDDLVIADQLVCWLGTFVFCILCLISSSLWATYLIVLTMNENYFAEMSLLWLPHFDYKSYINTIQCIVDENDQWR